MEDKKDKGDNGTLVVMKDKRRQMSAVLHSPGRVSL